MSNLATIATDAPVAYEALRAERALKDAQAELARRELMRRDLLEFTVRMTPFEYKVGWFHRELCDKLAAFMEAVERGEAPRLILQVPPRHGKSVICSEMFPPWILGHHPDWEVVSATYGQVLADTFGRRVRSTLNDERFQDLFKTCKIDPRTNSAALVGTTNRGSYRAVGIGGGLSGNGAHIMIIDDPVKDREEAESDLQRDAVWGWYSSVARTRLAPGGGIIEIQCMTGDTPVLMADGAEKDLRDVRPGDEVATYEDGRLTTSTVRNWANQGPDLVFAITMKSGTVVRANERHPFLVERDGVLAWVRVRNLIPGDNILRVTGESGKGSSAQSTAVTSPPSAKGFACPTTGRTDGPGGYDPRALTLSPGGMPTSSTGTGSLSSATSTCSFSKTAAVRSAGNLPATMSAPIGAGSCVLTTATTLGESGDSCVTTATSRSGTAKPLKSSKPPRGTYELQCDTIVTITVEGHEDVFDIEVERTENFIANGLVSHNTRWHEDDLAGRLLEHAANNPKADQFLLVDYPAIALEDEEHRTKGEALHPERYSVRELELIRASLLPRDWNALYQQRPTPEDGDVFKRDQFIFYNRRELPPKEELHWYISCDPAITQKEHGDYTVIWPFAVCPDGLIWFSDDVTRARLTPDEIISTLLERAHQYSAMAIIIEGGTIYRSLEHEIQRRMMESGRFFEVLAPAPTKDKVLRSRALSARMGHGRVRFPNCPMMQETLLPEFLSFPNGKNDDGVDTASWAAQTLQDQILPSERVNRPRTRGSQYGFQNGLTMDEIEEMSGDPTIPRGPHSPPPFRRRHHA